MITKEKNITCKKENMQKRTKRLLVSTSIVFCTLVFVYSYLICKFIATLNMLIA